MDVKAVFSRIFPRVDQDNFRRLQNTMSSTLHDIADNVSRNRFVTFGSLITFCTDSETKKVDPEKLLMMKLMIEKTVLSPEVASLVRGRIGQEKDIKIADRPSFIKRVLAAPYSTEAEIKLVNDTIESLVTADDAAYKAILADKDRFVKKEEEPKTSEKVQEPIKTQVGQAQVKASSIEIRLGISSVLRESALSKLEELDAPDLNTFIASKVLYSYLFTGTASSADSRAKERHATEIPKIAKEIAVLEKILFADQKTYVSLLTHFESEQSSEAETEKSALGESDAEAEPKAVDPAKAKPKDTTSDAKASSGKASAKKASKEEKTKPAKPKPEEGDTKAGPAKKKQGKQKTKKSKKK